MVTSCQHFDIEIPKSNPSDAIRHFVSLLRPSWNLNDLKRKTFTDGITNTLIACYVSEDFENADILLVRIYGKNTDLIIDRGAELRNMLMLHRFHLGAEVYASFTNGLCYAFHHGQVADMDILTHPLYSRLIAKTIARLHTLPVAQLPENVGETKPCLFNKINTFYELIVSEERNMNERYRTLFPDLSRLKSEIDQMESELVKLGSPVVFCHNDILIKNIVIAGQDRVHLIDYEYADFNYAAFEIGNHFCEFAGVESPDYSRYPKRDFQLNWLRAYLTESAAYLSQDNTIVSDAELERWYAYVNKFALASHLLWSLWAIIQARFSEIDFDYLEFAIQRYNEYLKRKDEFLEL